MAGIKQWLGQAARFPLSSSLSPQCPAQRSETTEGPPARVVAAGPPAFLCVTAIVICKCDLQSNGWDGRDRLRDFFLSRWAPGGSVRYCHCDLQSNHWNRLRDFFSLSPQCPAQCSETAKGPPARVVAAGPPAVLYVIAIMICKAMRPGWVHIVSVHYCHCDFHSIGSCRFGVAL